MLCLSVKIKIHLPVLQTVPLEWAPGTPVEIPVRLSLPNTPEGVFDEPGCEEADPALFGETP
jgi:hypothetical protein